MKENLIVAATVNAASPKTATAVRIYPNPVSGAINMQGMQGKVSYRITDAMGRELRKGATVIHEERILTIATGQLLQGAYFLHYQDAQQSGVAEFYKK